MYTLQQVSSVAIVGIRTVEEVDAILGKVREIMVEYLSGCQDHMNLGMRLEMSGERDAPVEGALPGEPERGTVLEEGGQAEASAEAGAATGEELNHE